MSVCYNCFKEKPDGGACPHCGYDADSEKKKYILALPAGTVLAGKYVLGRVLGQGGFGITYAAQDFQSKTLVAIKEFFPDSLATRTNGTTVASFSGEREDAFNYGKECFLAEAKTLSQFIGNPNIVRVYNYFEENDTAYFTMEYLKGMSLMEYLKQQGGRLTFDEAMRIIAPVMDALSDVHAKGIIHRDISPDNIFIAEDGTVKLIDFGAARYSLGDRSRSLDMVLKHGYAPKEQYTRRGRQGPFTDVYALAATIYRAITGQVPPDSVDRIEEDDLLLPSALGVTIPPRAEDALITALAVYYTDRFQTMQAFKAALLEGSAAPAAPAAPQPKAAVPPAAPQPAPVQAQPAPAQAQPAPAQAKAPQPVAPAPAKAQNAGPKKRKTGLIIGVAAAAVVVIAAIVLTIVLMGGGSKDNGLAVDGGSAEENAVRATEYSGGNSRSAATEAKKDNAADIFGGEDHIELLLWVPSADVPIVNELCRDFVSEHPDKTITIDVNVMEVYDAASSVLSNPAGAADIFGFACDQLPSLHQSRAIDPLTRDEIALVRDRDSAASVNAATLDGEVLAFPETGENGYYLVYDKSVISDEDAQTLEGVLAACRKSGRKFVIDVGNGFYSCMFAFTGGLEVAGLDGGTQQFNYYDEERVVDSLVAFNKIFAEYKDVIVCDLADSIGTGMAQSPRTVAAGVDGSWNGAQMQNILGGDYGAKKLPTIKINGTDTQIISMNGYKLMGVNSTTLYPNAAHLLASYLTDEKAQRMRAEQLGWSPSNKMVVGSSAVAANKASAACLEQANYSVPQINIAPTFWSPMGTLGNYICKEGVHSRDQIKATFEKTIANIRDE